MAECSSIRQQEGLRMGKRKRLRWNKKLKNGESVRKSYRRINKVVCDF